MKIRNYCVIFSALVIALFYSFISPEPQQDKNALNISDFSSTNNRISRGKLAVYSKIKAGFGEDFAFDGLKIDVTSYMFVHVPKNGQVYIENVNGNGFTPSIRARLLQVKPGDVIIISDVNVKGHGWNYNRKINGPVLTVY